MKNRLFCLILIPLIFISPGCKNINQTPAIGLATKIPATTIIQATLTPTFTPSPSLTKTMTPLPLSAAPTHTQVSPTPTLTSVPLPTLTEISGEIVTDPNKSCKKVPDPKIVIHPEQGILMSGTFALCRQWPLYMPLLGFDLDTGIASVVETIDDNPQNDLYYWIKRNTFDGSLNYYLLVDNNASLYVTSDNLPSFQDCQDLILTGNNSATVDVAGGIGQACFLTTQGQIAYVRVEGINQYGWGSLSVFFVTWERR